ncbi:MAG: hypothetical protein GY702_29240 [Desulfobulbaceae bacterium]|nr:hypothetical protein [Desulfobulbaceae bacterium]
MAITESILVESFVTFALALIINVSAVKFDAEMVAATPVSGSVPNARFASARHKGPSGGPGASCAGEIFLPLRVRTQSV